MRIELFAHLREAARDDPRLQDGGDHFPGGEAVALLVEVEVHLLLDLGEGFVQARRVAQAVPLVLGQSDDHDPLAFARREVAAECAVEIVPVFGPLRAIDLDLGDLAEIADHGEGDVRQRHAHQLPLAIEPPMALGGEQAGGRERAGDRIPGR